MIADLKTAPTLSLHMHHNTEWIYDVDLEHFDQRVLQVSHHTPVLVDFWAEWCSPCLFIAPVLKDVINAQHGRVLLAKVEVDEGENMKLAGRYQVRGFPTIILFRNGKEIARFTSAQSRQFIERFLDVHCCVPHGVTNDGS